MIMRILNVLTVEEFQLEYKMKYFQLVAYLKNKYGSVQNDYGKGSDSLRGLFIHHIMEWRFADLSSDCGREEFPEYQKAEHLVYCNWLEHLLLHGKIYREWNSPRKGQEDNGALNYIIPNIYAYLEMNKKVCSYSDSYYNNINNKDALTIFKCLVCMFNLEYNNRTLLNVVRNAEKNAELDGYEVQGYKEIITRIPWSTSEIEILTAYYSKGSAVVKDELIKINDADIRTTMAIHLKARQLGLATLQQWWTDKEIATLYSLYPTGGVQAVYDALNGTRTRDAIEAKVNKLKIRNIYYNNNKMWKNHEEEFLISNYSKLGPATIAEILNRTYDSVARKAHKLHLHYIKNT